MKMQSLYFTKSGNAQVIADRISREFKCKCDQIPPAYPCETETLVCITFESGKIDKKLSDFCKNLTPVRAVNVGLCVVGPDDTGLSELKGILVGNGVNIMSDVLQISVKKGLFGQGKVTEADATKGVQWATSLTKALNLNM